ncbi:MAG TPA: hypothetical protein VJ250_01425, partial [Nitrososphaeraceae archaeon]|nr:hypothetical protein [Nitrososphaeraceae archaeon]
MQPIPLNANGIINFFNLLVRVEENYNLSLTIQVWSTTIKNTFQYQNTGNGFLLCGILAGTHQLDSGVFFLD